ncbi:MAG: hypothetical protein AAF960_26430 [Bacteroidota bacterium]
MTNWLGMYWWQIYYQNFINDWCSKKVLPRPIYGQEVFFAEIGAKIRAFLVPCYETEYFMER